MDSSARTINIALAGNPNSGKSSLFNALTGLSQKVGNYPGVTVDRHTGRFTLFSEKIPTEVVVTDLPGSYSIFPKSEDEKIASETLIGSSSVTRPDLVFYIADASNLKRSLFYCTQIMEQGLSLVLVLNMVDIAAGKGIEIDHTLLSQQLQLPVVPVNARTGKGINILKREISTIKKNNTVSAFSGLGILQRYEKIAVLISPCIKKTNQPVFSLHDRLDRLFTHRITGYAVFLVIMLLIFQSVFSWSEYPMGLIEKGMLVFGEMLDSILPKNLLSNLLIKGVLPGLSGILIFIPQIAVFFFFIALLEDTGYMARVSFIMDRLMRSIGLNGRSVIPLMGGMACAVPAIMGARTISNRKERLITILVTPFMTCSARIPVYILLISLILPEYKVFGFFNLQGLVLMGLYLLGGLTACIAALILSFILKNKEKSFFIMEMPTYKSPRWTNIGFTILEKVKVFVTQAGKVIIVISIVLWALASFGPGTSFEEIEHKYNTEETKNKFNDAELSAKKATEKLESSYAAMIGKVIEPALRPLGFDWKIGIALITSFAAREVFVGTMATIYSAGEDAEIHTVREKMREEKNQITGTAQYNFATGISLLLFYAFAMQCMSTLAVVHRETQHWKWPVIQLAFMTGWAYLFSLIAYQVLR